MSSSLTRFQDNDRIAKEIDDFARKLEELRTAYDQYFNGLTREQPIKAREAIFELVRKFSGVGLQNGRLRFKVQQTIAKYNTYATLWDRILREIEEGRYKNDLFRMRLHSQTSSGETKPVEKKPPVPKDPLEPLFEQYIAVRRRCNETTEGLTFETFKKGFQSQMDQLKPKIAGKKVRVSVVAENGKAKIKTTIS